VEKEVVRNMRCNLYHYKLILATFLIDEDNYGSRGW